MNNILKRAVVSEKTSMHLKKNKYTFEVSPDVNKIQIEKKIVDKFNVKVKAVNVLNRKGKKRRKGRIEGRMQDRKFAIVTLADGQTIDEIKGLF
ncbi:MAG: 50S ribosomal protein L23 [Candidatus Margulisbacteria bacterium]|nr:50S ribosomal protein L23 [Candidatus Margulisiibacteriota bacterium]